MKTFFPKEIYVQKFREITTDSQGEAIGSKICYSVSETIKDLDEKESDMIAVYVLEKVCRLNVKKTLV